MVKKMILACILILIFPAFMYAAQFSHLTHKQIKDLEKCENCHKRDAVSIIPPEKVCMDCHSVDDLGKVELGKVVTHGVFWYKEHKSFAMMKPTDDPKSQCINCHQESFCLDCHRGGFKEDAEKARVHRSDLFVTHPIMAKRDSKFCASCHEEKFCIDCHNRFNRNDLRLESHRRSWSDMKVTDLGPAHEVFTEDQCQLCHPDSILPKHEWSDRHAREARRSLYLCATCHENADVCIKCHSARTGLMVNPHPKDWDDIKENYRKASDGKTCRECH